jgi:hypothetical protein
VGNTSAQNFRLLRQMIENQGGGRDWLAVWQRLSPGDRQQFDRATAGGWGSYQLFFRLIELGAGQTGADPLDYARQFAMFQVQHYIPRLLKAAIRIGGHGLLIMEAGSIWKRYHDSGTLELYEMLPTSVRARLLGVDGGGPILCAILQGFSQRGLELTGKRNVTCEHPCCLYRGENQCLFHARWDK